MAAQFARYGNCLHQFQYKKISWYKHAILAAQTLARRLRGQLAGAWDVAEVWSASLPVSLRRPCPESLLWLLFTEAVVLATAVDTNRVV